MIPVTRIEIANHLDRAFDTGRAGRSEILHSALSTGARSELLAVLRLLPDKQYSNLRQLWIDLPHVPVEA